MASYRYILYDCSRMLLTCTSRLFITLLSTLSIASSQGQTQSNPLAGEDASLARLYTKLTGFIGKDYDSIEAASAQFDLQLLSCLEKYTASLGYSFPRLSASSFSKIHTSPDGKFRIYSWDTWTGGTMHMFHEIFQWESNGHVYTKATVFGDGDPGSFCSNLIQVELGQKRYYLAVKNGIYSTKDAMQSVQAYRIVGNQLADTCRIFHTLKKSLSSIEVNFDFFSVVDRPERPLRLIVYDERQKTLFIPVVNEKNAVTAKYFAYEIQGAHFQYTKIKSIPSDL